MNDIEMIWFNSSFGRMKISLYTYIYSDTNTWSILETHFWNYMTMEKSICINHTITYATIFQRLTCLCLPLLWLPWNMLIFYVQQDNHHEQLLMRCSIMLLKGKDQRKCELDQAHKYNYPTINEMNSNISFNK